MVQFYRIVWDYPGHEHPTTWCLEVGGRWLFKWWSWTRLTVERCDDAYLDAAWDTSLKEYWESPQGREIKEELMRQGRWPS